MPVTYESIATTTLGTTASDVTFSNIPGTFTDLIIVFIGTGTSVDTEGIYMQYNADTGNNYSQTYIRGTGSAASSARQSNNSFVYLISNTTNAGMNNGIAQIQNYSNTTTYKTNITRGNDASARVESYVGLWRNTNAITSIRLVPDSGTIDSGATFTLYGIKAA
jgi:hypothetical protein